MNNHPPIRNQRYCCRIVDRQASSLIEVVVMASVTSMMLVMVTSWIHQTMKQSARFRTERHEQLSVSQLSQHFRKHVWLSNAADLSDPKAVSLTNPTGEKFTYRLKDQQIHFTQVDASGEPQAFERFELPSVSTVTFDRTSESGVALKIERSFGFHNAKNSDQASNIDQVINPTLSRWLPGTSSSLSGSSDRSSSEEKEVLE